jgi:hypothetical protein
MSLRSTPRPHPNHELTRVPAQYREEYKTGFFVFFQGKFCGWTAELPERKQPFEITSWRPDCLAISIVNGERFLSVGGTYHSGADGWEKLL